MFLKISRNLAECLTAVSNEFASPLVHAYLLSDSFSTVAWKVCIWLDDKKWTTGVRTWAGGNAIKCFANFIRSDISVGFVCDGAPHVYCANLTQFWICKKIGGRAYSAKRQFQNAGANFVAFINYIFIYIFKTIQVRDKWTNKSIAGSSALAQAII